MTDAKTIEKLETQFWDSMLEDGNPAAGAQLLTDPAINVAGFGAMQFTPDEYLKMATNGHVKIQSYKLSDVKVTFPADNVAIIVYQVSQQFTLEGKPMDQICYDTTTWVRDGNTWKVACHTESVQHEQ